MPDEIIGTEEVTETPAAPVEELERQDLFKHSSFYKQAPEPAPAADNPTEEPAVKEPEAVSQEETPPAEPPKFKLSDDEEVTAEQILEWKKGYMMQSNYTQKTQALAEERRQFEKERAGIDPETGKMAMNLWKQMELDPIGTIDRLREHYEAQGIFEAKDQATLQLEQQKLQLEAEKRQFEQRRQQQLQQEEFSKLETQLSSLEKTYGKDFDRQATVQFMIDNKMFDAEKAFKALHHDTAVERMQKQLEEMKKQMKTVKSEAVNEYVQTKTTKKASPPPVGASISGSPPVQFNAPKTFEDAKKAALARMSNLTG